MKNSSLNRRKFLKATLATSATAVAGTSLLAASPGNSSSPKEAPGIIYRELGKTGLRLPIVSMGVMRADNPALVKEALRLGILHLDTAHVYQGGKNEEMLGELLKDYPRDSYVIASKVLIDGMDRKTGKFTKDTNPDEVFEKLNTSLERLGIDYVDILYLHAAQSRETTVYKPVLKELKRAKEEGKARFLGVSTHRNMAEVIQAATDSKVYDVVLTSYNFQMEDDQEIKESIQKAADAGLGIVGMKTMAGGFLDKERKVKVNAAAALKWALQNENIHTTIPGYTSFEELNEAFGVMENLELSDKERMDLKLKDASASLFCHGCDQCVQTCKHGLNLPDYMRAYMYTYGYHEYQKAQSVLANQSSEDYTICSECDDCSASCPKGFNPAERLADVSRLASVPTEFFT